MPSARLLLPHTSNTSADNQLQVSSLSVQHLTVPHNSFLEACHSNISLVCSLSLSSNPPSQVFLTQIDLHCLPFYPTISPPVQDLTFLSLPQVSLYPSLYDILAESSRTARPSQPWRPPLMSWIQLSAPFTKVVAMLYAPQPNHLTFSC